VRLFFSILPERAAWTGVTAHRKPSRDLDPEQVRVGAISSLFARFAAVGSAPGPEAADSIVMPYLLLDTSPKHQKRASRSSRGPRIFFFKVLGNRR
jgi:hypothetical protein